MADRLSPQDISKKFAQLTARAWSDDAFKKRLLSDPMSIAKEYDLPVPPGTEIRIVEDTAIVRHFVLPPRPPAEELSDDVLEQVAGGACAALSDYHNSSVTVYGDPISPCVCATPNLCCF